MDRASLLRRGRGLQRAILARGLPPSCADAFRQHVATLNAYERDSDLGFGPLLFAGWALAAAVAGLAGILTFATAKAAPSITSGIEDLVSIGKWLIGGAGVILAIGLARGVERRVGGGRRAKTKGVAKAVFG